MAYFINSKQAQHFFNQSLKLTISSFFVKKKDSHIVKAFHRM